MGVNVEALQLHTVCKKPYFFYYKLHEYPYQYYKLCESQVLQVTCTVSKHAVKSKVCMIKSLSPEK